MLPCHIWPPVCSFKSSIWHQTDLRWTRSPSVMTVDQQLPQICCVFDPPMWKKLKKTSCTFKVSNVSSVVFVEVKPHWKRQRSVRCCMRELRLLSPQESAEFASERMKRTHLYFLCDDEQNISRNCSWFDPLAPLECVCCFQFQHSYFQSDIQYTEKGQSFILLFKAQRESALPKSVYIRIVPWYVATSCTFVLIMNALILCCCEISDNCVNDLQRHHLKASDKFRISVNRPSNLFISSLNGSSSLLTA